MTIQVPIKLLSDDVKMPGYAYDGDAGLDLRSSQNVVLRPGKRALIGTGIAVAIPEGYAGFVQPRSGLAVKHGITVLNSPGLIDSRYRGEVKVTLVNHGDDDMVVQVGDRIAQLAVVPVPHVDLVRVTALDETGRGSKGFGSSGV